MKTIINLTLLGTLAAALAFLPVANSEPKADERERARQNPAGQRQLTHKIYFLSSMVSIGQTMQKIDEI